MSHKTRMESFFLKLDLIDFVILTDRNCLLRHLTYNDTVSF